MNLNIKNEESEYDKLNKKDITTNIIVEISPRPISVRDILDINFNKLTIVSIEDSDEEKLRIKKEDRDEKIDEFLDIKKKRKKKK